MGETIESGDKTVDLKKALKSRGIQDQERTLGMEPKGKKIVNDGLQINVSLL